MKPGELYAVKHKWLLPRSLSDFWSPVETVIYIGEDVIEREDGVKITNHVVLAEGQPRILDQTFLKFLEPVHENR